MKAVEKRENKGFEIELYHPKEYGRYTPNTGNVSKVIQCDNVGEVAQFFARNSWGSPFGDSNYANPTVWYNGQKWCFTEESVIPDEFYYKGFIIVQEDDKWRVSFKEKVNEDAIIVRYCDTYAECLERIDSQTI